MSNKCESVNDLGSQLMSNNLFWFKIILWGFVGLLIGGDKSDYGLGNDV